MQDLNILYSNINSFIKKKTVINHYIQTNDIHCALFVETKTRESSAINYQNWNIIHQPGNVVNTNLRGGSLIQLHPCFKLNKTNPPAINNALNSCLHITTPFLDDRLHIFLTYIHPMSLIEENIFIKAALCKYAIVIGDFNVCNNRKKKQLDKFIKTTNFEIYKTEPTFIMPNNEDSTPDLILYTNNLKNNFKKVTVIPDLGADHLGIQIQFDMQSPPTPCAQSTKFKFHRCKVDRVNAEIVNYISSNREVNKDHINEFATKLAKSILANSPRSENKYYTYELPPFIIKQIKLKRKLYREYRLNKDPIIKRQLNELSKGIHIMVQQFNNSKWVQACKEINDSHGKKFYSKVNQLTRYRSKAAISSIREDDKEFSTDEEKAHLFEKHYKKAFTPENSSQYNQNNKEAVDKWYTGFFNQIPSIPNIKTDENEYFEILSNQKDTSPGHDSMPWTVLKKLSYSIHEHIINIFNYCLNKCYFPGIWKTGDVIVIHKPNTDPKIASNYRPITLLPVLGKLFEKIIRKMLLESTSSYIPVFQYGFKAQNSTTHPLTILTSNVETARLNHQHTSALFLDINKAFDSVWHEGLLYKLAKMGTPDFLIHLTRQFLEGRFLKVRINNTYSDTFKPLQGVPQGSPLSPLLYNLYCYDIYQPRKPNRYILQYADDTALVAHGHNLDQTIGIMQDLVEEVQGWFQKWRLKPNPKKSQFMIFYHNHKPTSPTVNLINTVIKPSQTIKYLGVQIDNKINFKNHLSITKKKVITRAKYFRSLTYKNQGINIRTASKIYKSICRPLLEYAHPILINCNNIAKKIMQTAETSALRVITKMRHPSNPIHNPPNPLLYEKTGIVPINSRIAELNRRFAKRPQNLRILNEMSITRKENKSRFKRPQNTTIQILTKLFSEG